MDTAPAATLPSPSHRGYRWWLWAPAVVALFLRLIILVASGSHRAGPLDTTVLRSDAAEYHVLALGLLEQGRFVYDESHPVAQRRSDPWQPEPLRTPGYPAVIAAVYRIVGVRPGMVLVLQVLVEALTCLLLARSLARPLGQELAGGAALVYALHPGAALFSTTLLSEALSVLCLVAGFAALVRGTEDPTPAAPWFAASGAAFGLAGLVRPVLLIVPLTLSITQLARRSRGRTMVLAIVLLASTGATVAPWALRNAARHGTTRLSTSGAYNAMALYAAPLVAATSGLTERQVIDSLMARADEQAAASGDVLRSDFDRAPYWTHEATQVLRAQPREFVTEQVTGMLRLFVSTGRLYRDFVIPTPGGVPPSGMDAGQLIRWWRQQPRIHRLLDVWVILFALLAYPLLALGAWRSWRAQSHPAVRYGAVIAMSLLVVTGTPGHSRLMVPLVPFWAPFVALGAAHLRRWAGEDTSRSPAAK